MPDYDHLLVHLEAGDWQADILPSFGANLIRLVHAGRDLLRTPPDMAALQGMPILYGTPVLMPPNRTADGQFTFAEKTYQLPINETAKHNNLHGFFYTAPFRVVDVTADSLTCAIENEGDPYPFHFELTITFKLDAGGMRQTFGVHNLGDGPMPVILALHTAFAKPSFFSVPIGQTWEADERALPTGRLLALNEQEQQYRDGFRLTDQFVNGYFTAAGHTAIVGDYRYESSDCFDQWVLFGGGRFDFLCIEPQIAPVNSLNQPGSYPLLEAGETFVAWTQIGRVKTESV